MGWSLEELGAESGLDRTYVSGIENKRWNVSLKNLEKIAAALGTPAWALLLPPDDEEMAPRR